MTTCGKPQRQQQQHGRRARVLNLAARIEAATLAQFGEWSSGVWVLPAACDDA
jgi:hypothetical protein